MKTIKILIIIFLALFVNNTIAHQKKKKVKISITVKDSKNKPIPGAYILFDDVKHPRKTNARGQFKIKLEKAPKEISAFSPVYGIQKIKYDGNKNFIIKIKDGKDFYVKTNPKKKSLNPIQFKDIYDYLRGQVPGVRVSGNVITIRGYNSVKGSTTPLFILNNIPVDQDVFGNIVPTTIKSIKVLKGPETAIYGVRGANGIIEVTTL